MTVFWKTRMVNTNRGIFEVFVKGEGEGEGEGEPLCVTHLYTTFNHTGDLFADQFTKRIKVFLVNLREAGNSEKASQPYQFEEFYDFIGIIPKEHLLDKNMEV